MKIKLSPTILITWGDVFSTVRISLKRTRFRGKIKDYDILIQSIKCSMCKQLLCSEDSFIDVFDHEALHVAIDNADGWTASDQLDKIDYFQHFHSCNNGPDTMLRISKVSINV